MSNTIVPQLSIHDVRLRIATFAAPALERAQLHELARLVTPSDVCPSCWRLFSNGTRGHTQHNPSDCILDWPFCPFAQTGTEPRSFDEIYDDPASTLEDVLDAYQGGAR